MPNPTRADFDREARTFFESLAEEQDRPRAFDPDILRQEVAEQVELSEQRIRELEDALVSNDFSTAPAGQRFIAGRLGIDLASLPPEERLYVQRVAAMAERDVMRLYVHRLTRPWETFTPGLAPVASKETSFAATVVPAPVAVSADHPLRLDRAVERFLQRKRKEVGQSQHDEMKRALDWYIDHIGGDRLLDSVRREEVVAFRDGVEALDVRLRGRASLSFRERQTEQEEHWIRSETSGRYFQTIKAFSKFAKGELGVSNHAEDLTVTRRKGEQRKSPPPFSRSELEFLFKTPLFAGHKSRKQVAVPGSCVSRGSYWWAAILALFTGMRAGEIAQLTASDFVWEPKPAIKVRRVDDAGNAKNLKTEASIRTIPISPVLLELGLRQFVEARKKRPRILFDVHLGLGDRKSDGLTRFWIRYLKAKKLHKEGRATHVFRHTVAATLRASGVDDTGIGLLLGHTQPTETHTYGQDGSVNPQVAAAVAKLDYGFDVVAALGGPYRPEDHAA